MQVYTSLPARPSSRAPRELKAFAKVALEAGEPREVEVHVRREDLAYWDTRVDRVGRRGRRPTVEVGASSRDIRATLSVDVEGDAVRVPLTMDSSIGELLAHPAAAEALSTIFVASGDRQAPALDPAVLAMAASMPIGRILSFGDFGISGRFSACSMPPTGNPANLRGELLSPNAIA